MRSITVFLAGVLGFSMLAAQTRMAGPNATFGQVCIMSTVTGVINGQPVSGAGYGMLDTTGAFPSTYDINYDTVPGCIIPLTLFPCQLEAESGTVNLWQLSGGQFTCNQMYTWPEHPGDTVYRAIHSTLAGDTMVFLDSLFGQAPDPPPWDDRMLYAVHWTQFDSVTVAEQCTLAFWPGDDTGELIISSQFTGLRRQLPTPEVSKTYFPALSHSSNHSSVTWWGRTMPENHGRQIDFSGTIDGSINGQPVSGRSWGMFDTSGVVPNFAYTTFDSCSVPVLALVPGNCLDHEHGIAPQSSRARNLWSLTGGDFTADRLVVFPGDDTGDTILTTFTSTADGSRLSYAQQVAGEYGGPANLEHWRSSEALWHPVDSTTMHDNGRAVLLTSGGDSVVALFTSEYRGLRSQLDFDQTIRMDVASRCSLGCVAYTWTGTADSAATAIAEPRTSHRAPVLDLSVTPNPARGTTTINYVLPAPGPCHLGLYDVSGKLAATLASGYARAGSAGIKLRTSNLPKGIYVLRLASNGWSRATKLIVE